MALITIISEVVGIERLPGCVPVSCEAQRIEPANSASRLPAMVASNHHSPLFNHAQADVIIRSSDGTDFRMFKVDLSRSSTVFQDMFSFPQPSAEGEPETGLPVVDVSETKFCLPVL